MKDSKTVSNPGVRKSALWGLLWPAILFFGLVAQGWAAATRLPAWFPAQNLFDVGNSLVYQKFGKGSINDAQGNPVDYRGQYWASGVYPFEGQAWNWKKVYAAVAAGLKQQGYVIDYHYAGDASEDASFHKGSGDGSWHIGISFNNDSSSDSITIVQQAPLSEQLTLQPPAAKPAKVGDQDNFPYLTPLPGCKLFATEHDDSPMDYHPAQGDAIKPFGGSVMKRYNAPASLSPLEFGLVYQAALAKAGWTLDEKNAEQGYVYAHYDRNGRNIYLYASRGEDVSFVVAEPPPQLSITLKPPASKPERFGDHDAFPYLTPLPGWKLGYTEYSGDPLLVYRTSDDNGELVGSGAIIKMYQEDKPVSNDQFELTYERALTKAGWTIGRRNEEQGFLYAHYDKNGRDIWVYLSGGEHHSFTVSDLGAGLKAALAKRCKVAIYGVNFDFNKATLRPDAEPVLRQVLALFKDEPKLAVEIGGHTDNVGTPAYNQTLSEHRAAAVKAWLVAHGVASTRLTTHGYGQSRPLVANDSDAHRAKNRRVELKKPGCQE